MSASKKRNRKYIPRPSSIPVIFRFNEDCERELQLIPHAELLKLQNGLGDSETRHTLTARLNVGMVLANASQPQEVIDAMEGSLNAMRSIARRHDATSKYGASGDELQAISAGLVLTDDMQLNATRRELRDAIALVYRVAGSA